MSTLLRLGLGMAVVGACSFMGACSMSSSDAATRGAAGPSDERQGPTAGAASSGSSGTSSPTPELVPTDNAVILVHAAKLQPFRVCFGASAHRVLQPQPDSEAMPQANVVGVEVGSAVRIPSLPAGVPGKVYVFEEPLIRALYFNQAGGKGPSCGALIQNPATGGIALDIGNLDTDLSKGVHLLVVRGCPKDAIIKHSVAECGPTWTPEAGNLGVERITLSGASRSGPSSLPTQVVNLSQPLENVRGTRPLTISFGALQNPGKLTLVAESPKAFAAPIGKAVDLTIDPDTLSTYDESGFRVQVPAGTTAAQPAITIDYSLAAIQKLSAPRDVPSSYYAAASNYVLLLLGDPNAKLENGQPDTDPRNTLHFLAVPVVDSVESGGAPAPTPEGT
ncbi:MAG: hypothetical protein JST00_39395 [Deltaproteobacteria bacterium]|nr:hypothetical protein [Deltaproteobacteria bacterium]